MKTKLMHVRPVGTCGTACHKNCIHGQVHMYHFDISAYQNKIGGQEKLASHIKLWNVFLESLMTGTNLVKV